MAHLLIVSLPRSGSTWLSRVLSAASDVALCEEPDNQWEVPFAFRAKRSLPGRVHPLLAPNDSADDYEQLWRCAFGSGPKKMLPYTPAERVRERAAVASLRWSDRRPDADRSRSAFLRHMHPGRLPWNLAVSEHLAVPRRVRGDAVHVVVKSVYGSLSAEWIAGRLPISVLALIRSPYSVISSWYERGWLGEPGDDMLAEIDTRAQERLAAETSVGVESSRASVFHRAAFFYAVCTGQLLSAAGRHPQWKVVTHESLTADAPDSLRTLAGDLALPWSSSSDQLVETFNRSGVGYKTARTRDQLAAPWRRRLTKEQLSEIASGLDAGGHRGHG